MLQSAPVLARATGHDHVRDNLIYPPQVASPFGQLCTPPAHSTSVIPLAFCQPCFWSDCLGKWEVIRRSKFSPRAQWITDPSAPLAPRFYLWVPDRHQRYFSLVTEDLQHGQYVRKQALKQGAISGHQNGRAFH